ncbi:MAG: hypothetical protein H6R10_434 [Rhodocyclaceae bacterium]|nr:hypothetical protein [Rhodocyclaceae bacterium]
MKRMLSAAAMAAATFCAPVFAADVGVSVSVGQPGFYGRLDIGGYPPPPVIYTQPILVQPVPMGRPPVYLHVPPGHAKHWRKHCHEYNACGEPVYFVQDEWYAREYAPRYQERYRDPRGDDRGGGWENDRGGDRHEGRGNGHGRGHGRDH